MKRNVISRLQLLVLIILLGGMLSGCRKNAFTLEGKIEGGESSTIYLSWRAASGTRDFLASQAVPLTSTTFKVEGPVKRPSVIWVFSSGRMLLSAIYVERGNSLTLSGNMNEPRLWQISGNEVMEEVSAWAQANAAALKTGDPDGINRAVSSFVKANPDSRAALFLLYTAYERREGDKQFSRLLSQFKDKEMIAEMQAACLEPADASVVSLPSERMRRIDEVLNSDSLPADTAGIRRETTLIAE